METINDIIRELRSEPLAEGGAKPWLHYLADRIEKAIVCLTEDKVKKLTVWNEAVDEISKVCAENARLKAEVINKAHEYAELSGENDSLKAALKPVMDVHITQDDESLEIYDSTMDGVLSVRAVREAQRIYKEESKQ